MAEERLRRRQVKKIPRYICAKCKKLLFSARDFYLAREHGCPQCGCTEITFHYAIKAIRETH